MPVEKDKPIGALFTHVYLDRSMPLADSEVFRRRLGAFCGGDILETPNSRKSTSHASALATFIKHETGLSVPYNHYLYGFEELFVTVQIEYALNLITVVWRFLDTRAKEYVGSYLVSPRARMWLEFV